VCPRRGRGRDCAPTALDWALLGGPSTSPLDVRMGHTTTLRQELKRRFFPLVEARGFVRDESQAPHIITFRRLGTQKVEVFSLAWDKYGRPMFRISFNEAPIAGVTVRGVHIAAIKLNPQDPSFPLSLGRSQGPTLRSWFQLKKPLLERVRTWHRDYSPAHVVDTLLEAYAEMEEWWNSGAIGPHVWAPLNREGGFRTSNNRCRGP
jgi:hypothetical protein